MLHLSNRTQSEEKMTGELETEGGLLLIFAFVSHSFEGKNAEVG